MLIEMPLRHRRSALNLFLNSFVSDSLGRHLKMDEEIQIATHDEVDQDMFAEGEADALFADKYGLCEAKSAAGLEDSAYVMAMGLNNDRGCLAAALSDNTCCVFDAETLMPKISAAKKLHEGTVSGVNFDPGSRDIFYTSSHDATIKMWDIRQGLDVPTRKFGTIRDGASSNNKNKSAAPCPKPLTAMDVSPTGQLLCAGTEQVVRDTFLLFWDPRQESGLLGGYWDSHEDDVTHVAFHPRQHSRLASGGTDGVINVFDVTQQSEDDALMDSANTESSVQRLIWYGDGKSLGCLTHTEEILLWKDVDEDAAPSKTFNRDDVCASIRRKTSHTTYLVGGAENEDGHLVILSGSSCPKNPCLRLSTVKKNRLRPLGELRADGDLSDALTRAVVFGTEVIYTGGEDGVVRLWKKGVDSSKSAVADNSATGKTKSKKMKVGSKPY